MFGVEGHLTAGVDIAEPRQLHDRTPSRVQDLAFDVLDIALDAAALARDEDYLSLGRGGWGLRLALA